MTSSEQNTPEANSHESLFGYGHLRAHYIGSNMANGFLHVTQFVRPEHLTTLRDNLLVDHAILSLGNNTLLQRQITPVSRQCLWELHSGIMLRVLENITGLQNLLPDTHCRATCLLSNPENALANNWHEIHTGLRAALMLVIDIDSGDAIFCTNETALASIKIKDYALQATYWQYNIDSMKSSP